MEKHKIDTGYGYGVIIQPSGKTEIIVISVDNDLVSTVQFAVGGYFECISSDEYTAWLNEDGVGLKLDRNRTVVYVLEALGFPFPIIFGHSGCPLGPVLITLSDERPMTKENADEICRMTKVFKNI